jgi:hypothetical protein
MYYSIYLHAFPPPDDASTEKTPEAPAAHPLGERQEIVALTLRVRGLISRSEMATLG